MFEGFIKCSQINQLKWYKNDIERDNCGGFIYIFYFNLKSSKHYTLTVSFVGVNKITYATSRLFIYLFLVLKQFRLSSNKNTQQASVNDGNVTATVSLPSFDAEYGKLYVSLVSIQIACQSKYTNKQNLSILIFIIYLDIKLHVNSKYMVLLHR